VSTGGRRIYTIRSGDTLSAVADRFGITLEDLLAANPGIDPTTLNDGDTINLPEDGAGAPAAPTATPDEDAPTETVEPVEEEPTVEEELPTDTPQPAPPTETPAAPPPVETPTSQSLGTTYVVQAGDTFASIAGRFGVSIESLAEANPQVDSNNMQVGQVLFIPPAG
jgi:LysM repeat protein